MASANYQAIMRARRELGIMPGQRKGSTTRSKGGKRRGRKARTSPGRKGGRKRRSPAQIAATKRMLAANRARRG